MALITGFLFLKTLLTFNGNKMTAKVTTYKHCFSGFYGERWFRNGFETLKVEIFQSRGSPFEISPFYSFFPFSLLKDIQILLLAHSIVCHFLGHIGAKLFGQYH